MSITPPAWCSTDTNLFYGVSQADEQEELWSEFLATEAAAPYIDPSSGTIPEPAASSTEVKALYLQFLQGKLSEVHLSESANALSPKEVEARYSMLQAFEICLAMLKALQNCMKEQSTLLGIYTDWQKEYTKMMTATPVYGPVDNAKIIVNTDDFGETTFGYSQISINQIVDYLLSKLPPSGHGSGSVFWTSPSNDHGIQWYYGLYRGDDGSYSFVTDVGGSRYNADSDSTQTFRTNGIFGYSITADAPNPLLSDNDAKNAVIKGISNSLTAYVQNKIATNPTSLVFSGYSSDGPTWSSFGNWGGSAAQTWYNIGIIGPALGPGADTAHGEVRFGAGAWDEQFRGPYPDSSDDDKKDAQSKRQASQSYRGDVNAQLSQYTEGARANRTQVSNTAQMTQSLMDQTKDAITAQKDLLTAITESLKTLISAIFR